MNLPIRIAVTAIAFLFGMLVVGIVRTNHNGPGGGILGVFQLILFFWIPWFVWKLTAPSTNTAPTESARDTEPPSKTVSLQSQNSKDKNTYETPVTKLDNVTFDEESVWATALSEFEGNRRPGIWAKSFSEAHGDESVAKAIYLKTRATQILFEYHEESKKRKIEIEEQQMQARLSSMTDEERRYELSPKGICPNCEHEILLSLQNCPHCDAIFTHPDGWKIKPSA